MLALIKKIYIYQTLATVCEYAEQRNAPNNTIDYNQDTFDPAIMPN